MEGIECPEQLFLLMDQAPMYLQGYLLARPVPAEKLLGVIETLPNHMQSLLLTSPAVAISGDESTQEEYAAMQRHAL
jgi:hypothetical protein